MNALALRQLTAKFYAYAFFDDFILIYPFYTLLFTQSGITPGQIATFLIAWSGTGFIFEVPSGAIADKFNRKTVLVLATFIKALAFAAWLLFQNYGGFLAGFVLWGLSGALTSGTQEALLYDELSRLKSLPLYAKITGRLESIHLASVIAANFAAAILSGQSYNLLLICSVAAMLLSTLAVTLLPRSKRIEHTADTQYLSYLKQGVHLAFTNPVILLTVLFIGITALASVDEYFSLLLHEKAFDNQAIAIWSGVIGVFGIAGSLVAHRLENKKLPLELMLGVWALLLFASAFLGGIAVPIALGLFTTLYYLVKVVFTARLQRVVTDRTRATTTSVGGLMEEIFALIAYAVIGFAATKNNYHSSFYLLSLVIIVAALSFWIFARFLSRKHNLEKIGL